MSGAGDVVHTPAQVRRARYAVAAVFTVHGAVTGSFATRVPWIQDHAGVSAGPARIRPGLHRVRRGLRDAAGRPVTHRFGSRHRAARPARAVDAVADPARPRARTCRTLCLAMFTYGAAAGMADVAMNALGVEVERRLDKSIMSGLHGMWSAGALVGSAGGTLAAHLGSDARLHHALAAAVLTVLGLLACRVGAGHAGPPRTRSRPRGSRCRRARRC